MANNIPPPDPALSVSSETLAQAMRTFITARQNKKAIASGGAENSIEYYRGMAEAFVETYKPVFHSIHQTEVTLLAQSNLQGLLFNITSPIQPGQWVYQISSDTVAVADCTNISMGPAIGIVVSAPTQSTVMVQNFGSFVYGAVPFVFLPLVPDTSYFIGTNGNISSSPTPPVGGYIQEVGYAKNSSQLVISLREPTLI